jgi:hypothetical protein
VDVNGGHGTIMDMASNYTIVTKWILGRQWSFLDVELVPLAGIEPALLAESDFESALAGFSVFPRLSRNTL